MNIGEKIQTLYQRFGELGGISIECQKELIAIGIYNKAAKAEVFLQGAQISAYQRVNESPLLFLSRECKYQEASPLRGGIPICWPWFGELSKNNEKVRSQFSIDYIDIAPAHGFVRGINWEVESIDVKNDSLTVLNLEYKIEKDNMYGWPFSAKLIYTIHVGEVLQAKLKVVNTGINAFKQTAALHTYLKVNDINNIKIDGLDGVEYIDALVAWSRSIQAGSVDFKKEVDRIYQLNGRDYVLSLLEGQRKLAIRSEGSKSVVIWNPWIDKAKRLSQFADEEYKHMVCIETANAGDDVITIEPGQEHLLSLSII